jgi:hypothetical protein
MKKPIVQSSSLFLLLTVPLMVVFMAAGCEKPTNAETKTVTISTTDFEYLNLGCDFVFANMQAKTVYVINSEEEFENYFACETSQQIDFATKTLLIVSGTATGGIGDKSVQLVQNGNEYTFNIDIFLNFTTIASEDWIVAVIVDKIHTQNVALNLRFDSVGDLQEEQANAVIKYIFADDFCHDYMIEAGNKLYRPANLQEEFMVDNLQVQLTYTTFNDTLYNCGFAGYRPVIYIHSISINN